MIPSADRKTQTPRASYRCTADERREGRLQIGDREIPVEILDESADGFGILLNEVLAGSIGQTVALKTDAGWTEARVMHSHLVESTEFGEATDPACPGRTRLGLRRTKDLLDEESDSQPSTSLSRLALRALLAPLAGTGRAAATAAGLIVVVPLAAILVIYALEGPGNLLLSARHADSKATVAGKTPRPPSRGLERRNEPTPQVADKAAAEATRSPAKETAQIDLLRRSRPELLLTKDVSRLLALTDQQREQLHRIFDEFPAVVDAQSRSGTPKGADSSDSDAAIEMGQRVLTVLSAEQRKTWAWILAAKDDLQRDSSEPPAPPNREQNGITTDAPAAK